MAASGGKGQLERQQMAAKWPPFGSEWQLLRSFGITDLAANGYKWQVWKGHTAERPHPSVVEPVQAPRLYIMQLSGGQVNDASTLSLNYGRHRAADWGPLPAARSGEASRHRVS